MDTVETEQQFYSCLAVLCHHTGFEVKYSATKRPYYVNHHTRSTQWNDPRPALDLGDQNNNGASINQQVISYCHLKNSNKPNDVYLLPKTNQKLTIAVLPL